MLLRFAFRQLHRRIGFSLTVIVTLALGVGANLAIFQLLEAVLLTPLPISRPAELFALHTVQSPFDAQWFYSYPAYERLSHEAPVIAHSGTGGGVLQTSDGFSQEASLQMVSANFFSVLGLAPAAGRLFQASDDAAATSEFPVVLNYDFARKQFADASVIGMKATLNRVPVVVVGIAPRNFSGVVQGVSPDVWLPLAAQSTGRFGTWFDSLGPGYNVNLSAPYRNQEQVFWLWVLARVPAPERSSLAARWTQALQPDLQMIANATKDPAARNHILGARVQLVPAANGEGSLGAQYLRPLSLLWGMAAMFFLIGCLNLGNLQLARLSSREREISVRFALGASRWQVLRQLLAEDLLLLTTGGMAAAATSLAVGRLLVRWASQRGQLIPVRLQFGLRSVLVGLLLLLVAQAAFSLLPAWRVVRGSVRRDLRWSTVLLAAQVSLSLLLLSLAALFGQSLRNLGTLDAGVDRNHILSVHLDLVSGGLDGRNLTGLNQRILETLRGLPFVRDAAMQMCRTPGCVWNSAIHVSGKPDLSPAQMHGEENHVSTHYFRTMGIPVLAGRAFEESDQPKGQRVAILNQAFAQQLFGSDSPIGHYIGYEAAPHDHAAQIVGVVGNAHVDGLRSPAPPVAYFSLEQGENPAGTIEISILGSPQNAIPDIRRALKEVDPALPISEIISLDTEFGDGLTSERLLARLTATLAGLTLALAAIGFYGLLSFHVVRRTAEIGIRMALGATRGQVVTLFLRHTALILGSGILPGIVLTVVAGRSARTLLFGVKETDPWALALASGVLIVGGLLATLVPARRASGLDPVQTLRAE
jgi:predicted permease